MQVLVDLIYEAAVLNDSWPKALDCITERLGATGTTLFTVSGQQTFWTSCPGFRDVMTDYVAEGWIEKSTRPGPLIAARHAGFLPDSVAFTEEMKQDEPVYTDFLFPRGIGRCAGTAITCPHGDVLLLSIERPRHASDFSVAELAWLDQLRPHLARAALLTAQLRLDRLRNTVATLDMVQLPAAAISETGELLAANSGFQRLIPSRILDHRARLQFAAKGADALFAAGLDAMQMGTTRNVASFPVEADGEGLAFVAHLLPVRGDARDLFHEKARLLILNPVGRTNPLPSDLVETLFDLTPAEADVARRVAEGMDIAAIALRRGVSPATVRSQIKTIMAKTGSSRQSEMAMMLTLGSPAPLP